MLEYKEGESCLYLLTLKSSIRRLFMDKEFLIIPHLYLKVHALFAQSLAVVAVRLDSLAIFALSIINRSV
jgi:hypothetical protein